MRPPGDDGNDEADPLVYSVGDVLGLLDQLLDARPADRGEWEEFYADRARPVPFFVPWPDENLVEWVSEGPITPGRVLELGCGPGRNAVYLARQGYRVDAVDLSATALDWARERARAAGVTVGFRCGSVFDEDFPGESYDLVYDSGCFHHLPPHRRRDYLELVVRVLRPGGWFGLVCFRPDGGSGWSDREVYERRGLGGGLGHSRPRLLALCAGRLDVVTLRPMIPPPAEAERFGADFLWALLARKPGPARPAGPVSRDGR